MFCHFQNTSLINLVKISSCIFILFILHIVYMYTHKLNTHIDIYNYLHIQKTQLLKSFQQFLDVQRANSIPTKNHLGRDRKYHLRPSQFKIRQNP